MAASGGKARKGSASLLQDIGDACCCIALVIAVVGAVLVLYGIVKDMTWRL